MSQDREANLFIAVGFKGVGKTYRTTQELKIYVQDDPATGRRGRTVAILDANDEFRQFKSLAYDVEEKDEWKRTAPIRAMKGRRTIFRISPIKKNKRPMNSKEIAQAAVDLCNHYRQGLILFEDFNKYFGNKDDEDFVGTLVTLRHKAVDVIIHLQSLSKVRPTLWQNVGYIRFHKISDEIKRYKNRVPNYQFFQLVQHIVNEEYPNNQHYFVMADIMGSKMHGVTELQFMAGCKRMVISDPSILKKKMAHVDFETGRKQFKDQKEAFNHFVSEMKQQYL